MIYHILDFRKHDKIDNNDHVLSFLLQPVSWKTVAIVAAIGGACIAVMREAKKEKEEGKIY